MEDRRKTKEQLLNELAAARRRVAELEKLENDHKLADEGLREKDEMFRLFMEHSPIYVFFKDEQIRSMQLSKNYEKMLGRPVHELIGKTMNDLFPSELAESMVKDDLRTLNEGESIEIEEELNGRFYTTRKFPIIRQGKPPRLAGFTMDITEAKLAEKALREQEERFRTIFNAVSDAIFVQDLTNGAIVDVNERMCDMYGYTYEEALQLSIGILSAGEAPYTQEHALKWIRKAAEGEPQVFEWRVKDKAGRLFWVEVNMRRATIGGQDRLLVTVHDITEQKRAQAQILNQQQTLAIAEIQRARDQLLHLERSFQISQLTASLAHELNQPLAAILSNAQAALHFLETGNPDLNEIREILQDIVQDDKRAGNVIRSLRSLMKPEEGEKKPIILNDVLQDVVTIFHSDAVFRNVDIETDFERLLPPVLANGIQLQQVTLNLIMNAAQAMSENLPGERRIILRTEAVDNCVRASVRDFGAGIRKEHLEQLFQPFFTTKENGLGMGLAISKSIIEAHGGLIWAENNPEGGATFAFELPIERNK